MIEPAEPTSAQIFMLALDALEACLMEPNRDEAAVAVRAWMSDLDAVTARRVAGALAVTAAWQARPRKTRRTQLEWPQWIERARLEATWAAS